MAFDPIEARLRIKRRIENLFDTFELILRGFMLFLFIANLYYFFKGEHALNNLLAAFGSIVYLNFIHPPKRRESP